MLVTANGNIRVGGEKLSQVTFRAARKPSVFYISEKME
jgi:hypothetical protein